MTEQELALINDMAGQRLSPEDVCTFTLRLCDNEVDRDCECFPRETLEAIAPLFIGKIGIFDRTGFTNGSRVSRIYKTQVVDEPWKITRSGDPACYLKGWAYMLRTKENSSVIAEIENGINKEISIGCSVGKVICSICGEELGKCPHVRGRTYNKKLCYGELIDAKEAFEWSFAVDPTEKRTTEQ